MIATPIRYRRAQRGMFAQKLQHAIPSVAVLGAGIEHLSNEPAAGEWALGMAQIVAALAVMASVVVGIRKLRREPGADAQVHHGVDWIDIFIGVMLAVEAYAKYHETHRIRGPIIVLSVAMITLGLVHGRIAAWGDRRRELRVSSEGISAPGRRFARLTLTWAEVAELEIADHFARIVATDGRRQRFDFADLLQPNAVRDALMQARTFLDAARHATSASIESTTTDA